jgi:hypothetical protein
MSGVSSAKRMFGKNPPSFFMIQEGCPVRTQLLDLIVGVSQLVGSF